MSVVSPANAVVNPLTVVVAAIDTVVALETELMSQSNFIPVQKKVIITH